MYEKQIEHPKNHKREDNKFYPASRNIKIDHVRDGDKIQDCVDDNCSHTKNKAVECFGFRLHG